jgi:glycosyltransferase involved in cell wall biosynthesis
VKVLIGAYACEPSQGSEPAVGWHWALEAMHAGHEVWVVTRRNNRPAIEAATASRAFPSPHFEYLDLPRPFLWLKRNLGHPGLLAYYYLWQLALAFTARRLHRSAAFDVAHHVTFVNDSLPSGLCSLPIPFVWGPIGGSTHVLPESVELDLPRYARRHELVRRSLQSALRRLDPFVALTRRRAAIILVYTREALEGLFTTERQRARAVVHIGISADHPHRSTGHASVSQARLHILSGGRLVHWKGLDLLIEGFAKFVRTDPTSDARLIFTGTGRYESRLRELADREGIGDYVRFVGRLPRREDVLELMEGCDLFALPTLRDGPPVALLEAMAFGLPVLCLDLGATSELVPDDVGIKIAPLSRSFIVDEIARACRWVMDHPGESEILGQAGRAYALEHHDWARIREEIVRTYDEVLRLGSP